jgi:hypothetical protein
LARTQLTKSSARRDARAARRAARRAGEAARRAARADGNLNVISMNIPKNNKNNLLLYYNQNHVI